MFLGELTEFYSRKKMNIEDNSTILKKNAIRDKMAKIDEMRPELEAKAVNLGFEAGKAKISQNLQDSSGESKIAKYFIENRGNYEEQIQQISAMTNPKEQLLAINALCITLATGYENHKSGKSDSVVSLVAEDDKLPLCTLIAALADIKLNDYESYILQLQQGDAGVKSIAFTMKAAMVHIATRAS